MSVNRNKRSITLNLKTEEGKQILRELIAQSDILVENNRAGVMDRLGLGCDDARHLNPRIVYASIAGYGQTGPCPQKPAFEVIAQATERFLLSGSCILGLMNTPACFLNAPPHFYRCTELALNAE